MPYILKYRVDVEFIGTGIGSFPANAQKLTFVQSYPANNVNSQNPNAGPTVPGAGTGGAITGADVTTLTNNMATDIAAQMNGAVPLAQMQAWATTGGG
jgi:hypothetical protein